MKSDMLTLKYYLANSLINPKDSYFKSSFLCQKDLALGTYKSYIYSHQKNYNLDYNVEGIYCDSTILPTFCSKVRIGQWK